MLWGSPAQEICATFSLAALTQGFGERNAKYMYYACRGEVVSMDDCCSWTS